MIIAKNHFAARAVQRSAAGIVKDRSKTGVTSAARRYPGKTSTGSAGTARDLSASAAKSAPVSKLV